MGQRTPIESLSAENAALRQRVAELEKQYTELQKHTTWVEALIEQAATGLVTTTTQGQILSSNHVFQDLIGYTADELQGMSFKEFTHRSDLNLEQQQVQEMLNEERDSCQVEKRYIRKDGQVIWVRVNIAFLRDDAETPAMLIASVEEITAQRHWQEELYRSRALLRGVIDNVPAMVYVRDMQNRYILINKYAAALVNRAPNDMIGKPLGALFPSAAVEAWRASDEAVLTSGKPVQVEEQVPLDGGVQVYHFIKFPIQDDAGMISAIGGIGTNITERKQAEHDLRTFKALVESSPDAIGIATPAGNITYANAPLRTMYGYGDAIIGMTYAALFPPQVQQEELAPVHTTILERGAWHGMLTGVRSDGSTFPAQLTAFVIKNSDGTIQSLPAIIRDMTEQQRAEAAQAALREQVITTQQGLIRQLSTPLLPITSKVIALPLIGTIGSERAQQILETLLEGIAHHQSDIAILDITGVTVVDTQVAQALLQAARAVRLLGAQVVLTGIQPAIAQVLVQLGADLRGVRTFGTLQGGIAYAMGQWGAE